MKVLVTGANGFIGKNICQRLLQSEQHSVLKFCRDTDLAELPNLVAEADAVIHLAGENRPDEEEAFDLVNRGVTERLCDILMQLGHPKPILFASSTHAERDSAYGKSKKAAEEVLFELAENLDIQLSVFRLPGVFGKWCRPNYNSVVATFCHNIANALPIQVDAPNAMLSLVYIDDVVDAFLAAICDSSERGIYRTVEPVYEISLGDLAQRIHNYAQIRSHLTVPGVGVGLDRALYSTFVSYLPVEKFSYHIPVYGDERGVFAEMLKTTGSGQFSFFTAKPGITRGEHYHHTKTEKFLVVSGQARFGFRQIVTNQKVFLEVSGEAPTVVETIPGWAHDITNIGKTDMIVMLWANEVFDRDRPDTFACKV
ncbi:MAG: NAD-dependent epimerase/dehydratase family protein [Pseudomonadota bacterium]